MMKFSWFCCCLWMLQGVISAYGSDLDQYQSPSNALYWKHRKPHAAYWQQDVAYQIQARIDEKRHTIDADWNLEYQNNSPDVLNKVYLHLYQNAFVKGSYLEQLHRDNRQPVKNLGKYGSQGLGTTFRNLQVDKQNVSFRLDNTVLEILLPRSLKPGERISLSMQFTTYFDRSDFRRRMAMYPSWGFMHYNGVHWYPRICVYDAKKGWDTDQHLNKELYGEFGVYDVKLDFPENYVVEATGALQNPAQVFPGDLRQRLDISRFANKPWNEKPSEIIPYDSTRRKTWHYQAMNVHDFAFTADPHYRIGETSWNGIQCIALVTEPHAARWQTAANYIARVVETFSTDFGKYEYPKMVAADANDGMEYPMLTLCGGAEPDFHGLFAHEIGHNWFYGMIGNNETYRAALDEGFTQFITAWALEKLDGPYLVQSPEKSKYKANYKQAAAARDARVFNRYLMDAVRGEDKPLNTHSNDFDGAIGHENGYHHVYYKTATMLFNLQYVLGDSLFLETMKHYVAQWKIAHPYFEDFRQSVIQFTHQDLNWFFDQWLETTKRIDYRLGRPRKSKETDSYRIPIYRKEEMQMPLALRAYNTKGEHFDYWIPNTDWIKVSSGKALPKWLGWGAFNPRYDAIIRVPGKLSCVELDPGHRLADIDPWNNGRNRQGLSTRVCWQFDRLLNQPQSRTHYQAYWRPDLWWNLVDGVKLGLHVNGQTMGVLRKLQATLWLNTRLGSKLDYRAFEGDGWWANASPVDYTLRYESPLTSWSRKMHAGIDSRLMDGLFRHQLYGYYQISTLRQFRLEATLMYRPLRFTTNYLHNPNEWSSFYRASGNQGGVNSFLQAHYRQQYRRPSSQGFWQLSIRTPFTWQYAFTQAEWVHHQKLGKFDMHSRGFIRLGMGNQIPRESALYLQGANPEDMMESKFSRAHGIIPAELASFSTNEFSPWHQGGGLNLRGYTGYYALDEDNGIKYLNYRGRSGASINLELEFDRLVRFRPSLFRNWLHLDAYLFADGGAISRSRLNPLNIPELIPVHAGWSKWRMDAGPGFAFTVKRWGPFEKIDPLILRFDFPVFISAPPFAQTKEWDFRWRFGIGRAF